MQNQQQPKTYVPKCFAKARQTQFGEFISIDVDANALIEFANAHKNERGYLKLTVAKRKAADDRGNTHSVFLDTWKPDPNRRGPSAPAPQQSDAFAESAATFPSAKKQATETDDIPF